MLNNARKQRLMREAQVSKDGEMPAAEHPLTPIALVALILFAVTALSGFHQDDRKIVTAPVAERYVAAVHGDAPLQQQQDRAGMTAPQPEGQQQVEAGTKEPEGNVQDLTY